MSSADTAVRVFRDLESEDLRVLHVIETAMSEHEFVPEEQIARFSKLDLLRDTEYRIDRLSKLGLVNRIRRAYIGYALNYAGYDSLAINALVKADVLKAFGKSLGVGKEADVYDALNPQDERIAVKFHRLGRISFRQTRRKRSYTTQRGAGWLYQSRLAAEKEYQALKLLFSSGVSVPGPIIQNRHVVVMGMIDGAELADWRTISKPEKVMREILRNVKRAYLKAKIIHADLSEYNIILNTNKRILIIDWPQYVTSDHPNAEDLLKRDIKNVLQYFKRKYKLDAGLRKSVEYVTGQTSTFSVQERQA